MTIDALIDDLRANLGAEDWHDLDLIAYERDTRY